MCTGKMIEAYLGMGCNIGDRVFYLKRAQSYMRKIPCLFIEKMSPVYETSPIGIPQRNFLNRVLRIRTSLSPKELLNALQGIENLLGRKRTLPKGPRTMDLDIILYGSEKFKSNGLQIPHPDFHRRKFVLKPLCDLAPNLKAPGFKKRIRELLAGLTDPSQRVRLFRQ